MFPIFVCWWVGHCPVEWYAGLIIWLRENLSFTNALQWTCPNALNLVFSYKRIYKYWLCIACPIQWRQDRGGERIPSQEKDFEFLKSFQCFSSPLTSFVQPCQNWQKGWVNRVLVSQSFSDLISIISLRYVSKKYWLSNGALKSAHLK